MKSEFCNREELSSQWVCTLHCGATEVSVAIDSTRQSLYEEPLLKAGNLGCRACLLWGASRASAPTTQGWEVGSAWQAALNQSPQ